MKIDAVENFNTIRNLSAYNFAFKYILHDLKEQDIEYCRLRNMKNGLVRDFGYLYETMDYCVFLLVILIYP
jgi:hypothetical protein